MRKPNVVFVFGDQWRAQACGYAGDPNVRTPHIDGLAQESVSFPLALSGCPVCTPYRASLITGQYPLTHGLFANDICLPRRAVSLADAFAAGGYDTAYIGKWHLDGHGRSAWIPKHRRQGFDYWKVLECTHDYNRSAYYAGDSDTKLFWEGYDALAQTDDACRYIRGHDRSKPFLLVLSWGPPHDPYLTAPEEFRRLYAPESLVLRPNVPADLAAAVRPRLAGYLAHCSALDAGVGRVLAAIREAGIEEDTLFVFTSDHGDMVGSHGHYNKQRPWDESIRVPFLLRYPGLFGREPRRCGALIDAPDIMPTLLGLAGLPVPGTAEGLDLSGHLRGGPDPSDGSALIACYQAFAQWTPARHGGREYRGIRTARYTYVRDLSGPWLLFDNEADPYQLANLCGQPEHAALREVLDARLSRKLRERGDEFLPGPEYMRRWGYPMGQDGAVPYRN